MDPDILKSYVDLKAEAADLEKRIESLNRKLSAMVDEGYQESDIVKGTRKDGTYGSIKVTGFPLPKYDQLRRSLTTKEKELQEVKEKQLQMVHKVEDYIDGLNNVRMRRILRYRYIDGLSWHDVAKRMGRKYTADGCRMLVNRFLRKL